MLLSRQLAGDSCFLFLAFSCLLLPCWYHTQARCHFWMIFGQIVLRQSWTACTPFVRQPSCFHNLSGFLNHFFFRIQAVCLMRWCEFGWPMLTVLSLNATLSKHRIHRFPKGKHMYDYRCNMYCWQETLKTKKTEWLCFIHLSQYRLPRIL